MKISIRITIFLLIFILISFIIIESLIIWQGSKTHREKVDYIIILGAKLYGKTPSPVLLERLKSGLEYLNIETDVRVIVSGGQGQDEMISEAQSMKSYLMENGIGEDRIIVEDQSINTFQNIKYSLEKIREFDNREDIEVLLVTSKFHIFRSKLIAKRLGLTNYGLPAKVPPTTILPSYIREYFAVIKTFLLDK